MLDVLKKAMSDEGGVKKELLGLAESVHPELKKLLENLMAQALLLLTIVEGSDEGEEPEKGTPTSPTHAAIPTHGQKRSDAALPSQRKGPTEKGENAPESNKGKKVSQLATNFFSLRFHKKNGELRDRSSIKSGLAKYAVEKGCYPSDFLIAGEPLFKDGLGTFEEFKQRLDVLVHPSITDPRERARQKAILASYAAGGSYQIVLGIHSEKKGWPITGEDPEKDARNLYDFFGSIDTQIDLFKAIVNPIWKKYEGDPGAAGVAYYSGSAAEYKKNPRDRKWIVPQWGVSPDVDVNDYSPDKPIRGSIRSYALETEKFFAQFKKEMPGLNPIDYYAMAIEWIESKGTELHDRIKERHSKGMMDSIVLT